MKQSGQVPLEIELVSAEHIPDNLFVCSAKIKLEAGVALKIAFEAGAGLSKDLEATYNEHLIYTYDLGEKGLCWEAGPSADFTEILYIFSTNSIEEAQKLMWNDPFYKKGIFHGDWWFQWAIHSPSWKVGLHREVREKMLRGFGILPDYPPGVKPQVRQIKINLSTPLKLFASFAKMNTEYIEKMFQDAEAGRPVPDCFAQHLVNRCGAGGTGAMGYDWAGGPSVDWRYDLSIFSVNSIEMARLLRENDSFVRYGVFYDPTYFEWCIHMPFRKASPTHKEPLERFLRGAGVKLAE
jgi:hypothetical protein